MSDPLFESACLLATMAGGELPTYTKDILAEARRARENEIELARLHVEKVRMWADATIRWKDAAAEIAALKEQHAFEIGEQKDRVAEKEESADFHAARADAAEAEIAVLKADRDRLREALRQIEGRSSNPKICEIARAALAAGGKKP